MRRASVGLAMAALALLLGAAGAGAQSSPSARLAALDPAQAEALQRRLQAWEALPEALRRERREVWQAWRALPEAERERMRAAREAWRSLPIAEQQALRARFDALDAGIARGWLLGPVLGADWPRLHALFAQVPPEEREALLQALRALPAQARDDLAVLAQRIPPQERDGLRTALLAQPAAQRAQWLRQRVGP
ncbi:DUF3106 domain-containing protein [Luteimonas sp. SDU82]|uniref:DUF3106 domain-containing protein n=1 Tax=Luteimonas sp. SDU82 TaxID=3422592 RepID=UPI003EBD4E84